MAEIVCDRMTNQEPFDVIQENRLTQYLYAPMVESCLTGKVHFNKSEIPGLPDDNDFAERTQVSLTVELGHKLNRTMKRHSHKLACFQLSAGEPITFILKGRKSLRNIF